MNSSESPAKTPRGCYAQTAPEEIEKFYSDNQELQMEYSLAEAYDDITSILAREKASKEIEKMAANAVLTEK